MANILGTNGPDTLTGTDQADTINGLDGNDVLYGGAGNDRIDAGGFGSFGTHDLLYGEAGDDYLIIYPADGSVPDPWSLADGGDGYDIAELRFNFGSPLHYVHNAISADVTCGRLAGRLVGIEAIFFQAGYASDAITGGDGNDTIFGNTGDDTLDGGGGNDVLRGDGGNDFLTGGSGADIFAYTVTAWGADTVTDFDVTQDRIDVSALLIPDLLTAQLYMRQAAAGVTFAAYISGAMQTVTLNGVSFGSLTAANFVFSSGSTPYNVAGLGGDDYIVGQQANDTIAGLGGSDTLSGAGGADSLSGGAGADLLLGGAGNDVLDGGSGMDVAGYAASRSGATVVRDTVAHTMTVTTGLDGTDTLRSVEQLHFADGLYSFTFAGPGAPVVANFNPANGWISQNLYPRHVADMNGDGYGDIVGFGAAGTWISYGAANGTYSAAGLVVSNFGQGGGWASDDQYHRELADVNGDGKADILGFGYAGTWVSLAGANGTFAAPALGLEQFGSAQGWTTQDRFARVTGDINGDGKADIVGFGFAGAWSSLSNGNGTFAPIQQALAGFGSVQGWTSDNSFHRTLADVNGDGKADIVGFGNAGTWVALSKGDGTFADAQLATAGFGGLQGWSTNDSFPRLVADVNGDHVADIVGFGITGTWVSFGKGDGTFTDASFDTANFGTNQGWTSDGAFHREVADTNHDGLGDLVGFGIAGVFVGLNQGDFLI